MFMMILVIGQNNLKNNIHTSKFNTTKEDLKKNKQYKMAGKFVQNKKDIRSEDEEINFLKSIKLNPKILKIENSLISRASQMSQKLINLILEQLGILKQI